MRCQSDRRHRYRGAPGARGASGSPFPQRVRGAACHWRCWSRLRAARRGDPGAGSLGPGAVARRLAALPLRRRAAARADDAPAGRAFEGGTPASAWCPHPERLGIAAATSRAADAVQAEVLALVDQDDLLDPAACSALAEAFEAEPSLDFAYTDEDRLSSWGLRESPCFKPGPSPFLALSFNYAMHLMAFRRAFWARIGGARPGFDGAQDHDLLLRALESARRSAHLPLVAYTWRRSAGSVAGGSAAKPWAYEAGRRAVEEACRRRDLPVPAVRHSAVSGVYRWEPELPPSPLACGLLLLLGTDAKARTDWEEAIAASGAFLCEAHGHGTWPALRPEAGCSSWTPPCRPFPLASPPWRDTPRCPGVGAVALAARHPDATEHGWSVSAEGMARAMPDPGLAAAVPHEVATSLAGLLWLAPAPARFAARLAGQPPRCRTALPSSRGVGGGQQRVGRSRSLRSRSTATSAAFAAHGGPAYGARSGRSWPASCARDSSRRRRPVLSDDRAAGAGRLPAAARNGTARGFPADARPRAGGRGNPDELRATRGPPSALGSEARAAAIYEDYYRRSSPPAAGLTLEIGGAPGTSVVPGRCGLHRHRECAWLDAAADAQCLPFARSPSTDLVCVDVLDHVERPRVSHGGGEGTPPRGRIVLLKPPSPAQLALHRLHAEPVDVRRDPLEDGT